MADVAQAAASMSIALISSSVMEGGRGLYLFFFFEEDVDNEYIKIL